MRPKWMMVLEALLLGIPMKFPDGEVYRIIDGIVYLMRWRDGPEGLSTDPIVPLGAEHLTLTDFLHLCEQFTETDMRSLSYTVVKRQQAIENGADLDEATGYWKRPDYSSGVLYEF